MTKTMNHSNCTHPATKAGRAKCRRARASRECQRRLDIQALRDAYYTGDEDAEVIIGRIHTLGIKIDEDDDLETIIASL